MKKKLLISSIVFLVVIFLVLFVGTGFEKCSDVHLGQYSVDEDGTTLTINVEVMSSMGYTRGLSVNQQGNKKYITFYSAFGGLNGKIGARSTFEIALDLSCTEIYFYDANGSYRLVLQRDKITNQWVRPSN